MKLCDKILKSGSVSINISMEGSMEKTGIKPVVIQEICSLARKYDISKVILFGSRARGDYKRTSDIDLAVCGKIFRHLLLIQTRRHLHC